MLKQTFNCAALLLGLLAGCGPDRLVPPDRLVHSDRLPLPQAPKSRSPSLANEILEMSFGLQIKQGLDLPRQVRRLTGNPYQALDLDNFDRVANSSWFTNRNGTTPMSLEAIGRGPTRGSGPDTTGPWHVVALKDAGVTPGLTIVDNRGDRYIIKFDPPDFAELPSGTEVVASRLFYAAGYNTPENYIAVLDPDKLVPDPEAVLSVSTPDKRNPIQERPLTQADLDAVLARANPGGKPVRVLASRFLPGRPVGPWSYTGTRRSDLNDIYPHQHRRVIRGFYVIASWLNHADMKEENTLDMYDPQARVLTHYLIDFGASMGSNSRGPSNPRRGQANSFDLKDSLTRLGTLGLYVHGYEKAPRTVRYPSVGYLENELFRPEAWKPMYPVPAFENMTDRDAFWGAQIVTAFSDAQIAAAVETGQFSDPEAAAYMVRFLTERRDAIGRYWFARVNPLDGFVVEGDRLVGMDLAVTRGYADGAKTQYELEVLAPDGRQLARTTAPTPELKLQSDWLHTSRLIVSLRPHRPGLKAQPVLLYLTAIAGQWRLEGLRRQN
ncbi:MAG: hypothetical protein GKR89_23950 [Candidatus Latescibacteria bacterium]|nr:hypothetical protein [Candidatus Latescibacterota bacterium]